MSNPSDGLDTLFRSFRESEDYWTSFAGGQFVRSFRDFLAKKGAKQKTIAKTLGVSEQVVSRWLSGDANLTVESMARLALALDAAVYIHVADRDASIEWRELTPEEAAVPQPVELPAPHTYGAESRSTSVAYAFDIQHMYSLPHFRNFTAIGGNLYAETKEATKYPYGSPFEQQASTGGS